MNRLLFFNNFKSFDDLGFIQNKYHWIPETIISKNKILYFCFFEVNTFAVGHIFPKDGLSVLI
jgi:hypothetical protein